MADSVIQPLFASHQKTGRYVKGARETGVHFTLDLTDSFWLFGQTSFVHDGQFSVDFSPVADRHRPFPGCLKRRKEECLEQRELIEVYENDFSKHNGKVNSGRILMVFRSIVSQLGKANEKFMYGAVREGARARDFEEAIEWLVSAGMLNRVCNVAKVEHPLSAFEKPDQFKLFVFDTGLLKCMAGIDNSAILLKSDYQFKGPLTENYVLQQLCGQFEVAPHYYSDKNSVIDFILQHGTEIIPVEVKGGEDKSAPSFKRYIAEHKPEHALRFSARDYRKDGEITNIPLYLAQKTCELL